MNQTIEERVAGILEDLYAIDPALRGREDEMKKTIREMLDARPEARLDPEFEKELRERLLSAFSEKEGAFAGKGGVRSLVARPWFRAALGLAAAATLIVGITLTRGPSVATDGPGQPPLVALAPDRTGGESGPPLAPTSPPPASRPKAAGAASKTAASIAAATATTGTLDAAALKAASAQAGTTASNPVIGGGTALALADSALSPEAALAPKAEAEISRQKQSGGTAAQESKRLSPVLAPPPLASAGPPMDAAVKSAEALSPSVLPPLFAGSPSPSRTTPQGFSTEGYDHLVENQFLDPRTEPLSTFSIDVDTASYSNVRRFLDSGSLPPPDAVRIEELVNYFPYTYKEPTNDEPFAYATELAPCPWNKDHYLLRVGLQAPRVEESDLPPSNLVFLIDVSGSMQDENKLPLVKESLKLLVGKMRRQDRISLVVYAGSAGQVLAPTAGDRKDAIVRAIDALESGGSTAGSEGIELAYEAARSAFIKGGNNRVVLATDGDFNVGPSSDGELVRIIERERKSGVFLTILGFGMGNYQDAKMQKLADSGNGNYAYVDSLREAEKVLVRQMAGTLYTIAKDVKIQIEFNPATVASYRLLGYEKRLLLAQDFANDAKDAGELGAGHRVTVFYEIASQGGGAGGRSDLKYQSTTPSPAASKGDLMTIKLRYKKPDGDVSRLVETAVPWKPVAGTPSEDFRFAAAVAEWGLLLRDSEWKGGATYAQVEDLAAGALARGRDPEGYRSEFLRLVRETMKLSQH